MPTAQQKPIARRTTARAGNAVAVVEEVELPALQNGNGALDHYWDERCSDGLSQIDSAIDAFGLALGNAIRARLAAHVNDAIADVAGQLEGISPQPLP